MLREGWEPSIIIENRDGCYRSLFPVASFDRRWTRALGEYGSEAALLGVVPPFAGGVAAKGDVDAGGNTGSGGLDREAAGVADTGALGVDPPFAENAAAEGDFAPVSGLCWLPRKYTISPSRTVGG